MELNDIRSMEEQYLRDLYFERIGEKMDNISAGLDKLIELMKPETNKESEVNNVL